MYGFIRSILKEFKIGMNRYPPQYLIKLIQEKCEYEFLHLWLENQTAHLVISLNGISIMTD